MKMSNVSKQSLYYRLGGYDKIVAFLDGVCGRMMRDPQLGLYFKGHNEQGKRRLRQLFIDYFVEAAGGPSYYNGTDLAAAHNGLGILESEWTSTILLVEEALRKYKVPESEAGEFLSLFKSLQHHIVGANTDRRKS